MNDSPKETFKTRVREWAGKLDLEIAWLGVRPMRNKWASCSTNGHLNFNEELLGLDQEVWDYVIVHELLHFSVPNHGKLWKSLMRAHLGDYEAAERRLRAAAGASRSGAAPGRNASAPPRPLRAGGSGGSARGRGRGWRGAGPRPCGG